MKVVRVYTGDDNRSHFEEIDLPFAADGETTPPIPNTGVVFRRRSLGFVLDWHPAPRHQWVINLEGESEIEVGDGTIRRLGPGDALLAEDLTGQGHILRGVGDVPLVTLSIPLES